MALSVINRMLRKELRVMHPAIPSPPASFDGTLDELFHGWAARVLLAPEVVEVLHRRLVDYLKTSDPTFLARMVSGTTRGEDVLTRSGARMRPTDNSPAWQIHWDLFSGNVDATRDIAAYIESLPCHMFRIMIDAGDGVSAAGWHVAHIFDVKNGDTNFAAWDNAELTWRMVRNIHPCNYFYVPKANWQKYGGDRVVVAYFYRKFAERYRSVWEEFLALTRGGSIDGGESGTDLRYIYPLPRADDRGVPVPPSAQIAPFTNGCASGGPCMTSDPFSRLCFKADIIEPLDWDDAFCVVTRDHGTFRFTKREFYHVFPRVPLTKSYQDARIYHYPSLPERALPYRVTDCTRE